MCWFSLRSCQPFIVAPGKGDANRNESATFFFLMVRWAKHIRGSHKETGDRNLLVTKGKVSF